LQENESMADDRKPGDPGDNPYGFREDDHGRRPPPRHEDMYRQRQEPEPPQEDSGMAAVWGWIIFFLIFGVGNFILYQTTGIFIIPIPRR
jgi:hypothetical protein